MKKIFFTFIFLFSFFNISFSQNIDINLLKHINLGRPKSLDNAFLTVTNTAKPLAVAVPVGMFVTGLIKHDSILKYNSFQTAAALLVSAGITEGLKYAVHRTRPYVTYPFIENKKTESDPSFPSGHVSAAFAAATSLSLNFPKWYIITPAYLWAAAVAYSRLDLGMHYPSDVLAGALIGAGSSFLCYKIQQWLRKGSEQ